MGYGLTWDHQPEDVVDIAISKFVKLNEIEERRITLNNDGYNCLIEGDNYISMKALEQVYKNKVDMIYIDPPYNTGSQFTYSDRFKQKDDNDKHSSWLSMMFNRLSLAKELMNEEGVIVIHINEHEIANLILLMDRIFGEKNKIGVVSIIVNPGGTLTSKFLSPVHEYAVFYAKNKEKTKPFSIDRNEQYDGFSGFYGIDDIGPYQKLTLKCQGKNSPEITPNLYYPFYYNKVTGELTTKKQEGKDWICQEHHLDSQGRPTGRKYPAETMERKIKGNDIILEPKIRKGIFGDETVELNLGLKYRNVDKKKPKTVWSEGLHSGKNHGTMLLDKLIGEFRAFDTPKSIHTILEILSISMGEKKDALILDFFAGSGTTGHATVLLNKKDGGKRKFVLCTNNENEIAEKVTYKRMVAITKSNEKISDKSLINHKFNLKYLTTEISDNDNIENNKIILGA